MTSIITQPRTLVQCVVGGGGADLPALKFGNFQWQIEDTENDQATSRRPTRPLSSPPRWPARPAPNTCPRGPDQECGSLLSPQAS